ncbi:MAG: hypothetical protein GXZ04_07410, partial [Clostridiales bacterium]|nr:hypothetical protein [Clostridiales bacterium]
HHERAARALERLGILCYDVAKPMKECGCQETVFTNSLVGTKTGGRPLPLDLGGVTAQPIRVPGHTPGSIALHIIERALLLLGDSWNPQTWVFFPEALPVNTYAASFRSLMNLPFTHALAPHQSALISKTFLQTYANGLSEKGFASAKPFSVPGHEGIQTLTYEPAPGALLIFRV